MYTLWEDCGGVPKDKEINLQSADVGETGPDIYWQPGQRKPAWSAPQENVLLQEDSDN